LADLYCRVRTLIKIQQHNNIPEEGRGFKKNLFFFVCFFAAPPSNYEIDIDVRFFDLFLVNYLRSLIMIISLPLTLSNSINITDIDMTTGES